MKYRRVSKVSALLTFEISGFKGRLLSRGRLLLRGAYFQGASVKVKSMLEYLSYTYGLEVFLTLQQLHYHTDLAKSFYFGMTGI